MRKLLLTAMLLPTMALATGQNHTCQGGHNCNEGDDVTVSGEVNVEVTNDIDIEGGSGGAGGHGGDGGAGGAGGEGGAGYGGEGHGGNATVSINEEKNTPSIFSGAIMPADDCMGARQGGIAVAGFGASGGGSYVNPDCEKRDWARIMFQAGYQEVAFKIFCSSQHSKDAGIEFCANYRTKPKGWEKASESSEPVRDYSQFNSKQYTREEADERCRRMNKSCDYTK